MANLMLEEDFMWGYQEHFHIKLKIAAEELFGALDSMLKPQVRLLGIRTQAHERLPLVSFEPRDGSLTQVMFNDIANQIEHHKGIRSQHKLFYSHPSAEANAQRNIEDSAKQDAILDAIRSPWHNDPQDYFIARPVEIGVHQVFIILSLDKSALQSHYSLSKESYGRFRTAPRSLIESTISHFLYEGSEALRKRHFDESFSLGVRRTEEILKRAAIDFFDRVNAACNQHDGSGWGYNRIDAISSQTYERGESRGQLIFCPNGHKNIEMDADLLHTISLGETRAARKLVEMSSSAISVVSDGDKIIGLGHMQGSYDHSQENLFVVTFFGAGVWILAHAEHQLMKVSNGIPSLPKESKIDEALLKDRLKRVFGAETLVNAKRIFHLAVECTNQKKGTMLVITSHGAEEASRLSTQALQVSPIDLNADLLSQASKIDGAVLLDPSGVCHAFGVILDGVATKSGASSRGARFNSAVRYIETRKGYGEQVLILVFSEDGTVDLLPDLPPRVSKLVLRQEIDNLKRSTEHETTDTAEYHRVLDWLGAHRLYIDGGQAKEINNLKKLAIEKWPPMLDVGIVRFESKDFDETNSPDPEWLSD